MKAAIVVLADTDHQAHNLYERVEDTIRGACSYCADAFGTTDALNDIGVPLLDEYKRHPSFRKLIADGYLDLDDAVRPRFSRIDYTVDVDSDARLAMLDEIRRAAARTSPMFDNVTNGAPITATLNHESLVGSLTTVTVFPGRVRSHDAIG